MNQEITLYQDNRIAVTNARFSTPAGTYALSQIAGATQIKQSRIGIRAGGIASGAFGLLCIVAGISHPFTALPLAGVLFLVCGLPLLAFQDRHFIELVTVDGQRKALAAGNAYRASAVVQALHQALIQNRALAEPGDFSTTVVSAPP